MKRLGMLASLVLFAGVCAGCSGFSVNLHADPDPANLPGQPVTWTLTVRNQTACATADDVTLPPPFPSKSPPMAFIIGFNPNLGASPEAICRAFRMCTDLNCVLQIMGDAIGPDAANQFVARLQAKIAQASSQLPLMQSGMCMTTSNDPDGFFAECELDPLAPGALDTVTFVDTAPNSPNHQAAQLAFVTAAARGTDCRPGIQVEEGIWEIGGCFPLNGSVAPVMSLRMFGVCTALLFAAGIVHLYHRRRA